MNITKLEVFDLYGDGTLVLKTNVDKEANSLRYAWYVQKDKKTLYKSEYQDKPFLGYRISIPGKYKIKAFVRDILNKEKTQIEIEFLVNRKTSPLLMEEVKKLPSSLQPVASQMYGEFWRFSVSGDLPQEAEYAWYVYQQGESKPVFRGKYSTVAEYIYKFETPGLYRVKLFTCIEKIKTSEISDWFLVILDS